LNEILLAMIHLTLDPWRAHSFVFAGPCLMEDLEEQPQLGPSMEQEAHRSDAMTHTLGVVK